MERDDNRADLLLILFMLGVTALVAGLAVWIIIWLGKVSVRHLAQHRRDRHLEQAKRRAALKG